MKPRPILNLEGAKLTVRFDVSSESNLFFAQQRIDDLSNYISTLSPQTELEVYIDGRGPFVNLSNELKVRMKAVKETWTRVMGEINDYSKPGGVLLIHIASNVAVYGNETAGVNTGKTWIDLMTDPRLKDMSRHVEVEFVDYINQQLRLAGQYTLKKAYLGHEWTTFNGYEVQVPFMYKHDFVKLYEINGELFRCGFGIEKVDEPIRKFAAV